MRVTSTKRRKRARTHGFRVRQRRAGGRATFARRRRKGRIRLSVSVRRTRR